MEIKKLKPLSNAALIISILPLATLIPTLLKINLPAGVRTVWAGANIFFVLMGLILSIICVRKEESRSVVNIVDTDDGWHYWFSFSLEYLGLNG